MSFKLFEGHLKPAEGEVVVRSYHCTGLSPLFAFIGMKINGYLTVTNKRLVYLALGSSLFGAEGSSKRYTEVPVADVANMTLSRGTRFSLFRLVAALAVQAILALLVLAASFWWGQLLLKAHNPLVVMGGGFVQLLVAAGLLVRSLWVKDAGARLLLATAGAGILVNPLIDYSTGKPSLNGAGGSDLTSLAILSGAATCYLLICLFWFVRREYLTIAVSSKGGMQTPIKVEGHSFLSFSHIGAAHADWMAPAVDAGLLFKELGALVTDIQTLGDHAVEKWSRPASLVGESASEAPGRLRGYRLFALRTASFAVLLLGVAVCGEMTWRAVSANKDLAVKVREETAVARKAVEADASIRQWVPKMIAAAEAETAAGETAFIGRHYTAAKARWAAATALYQGMPEAVVEMKNVAAAKRAFDALKTQVFYEESLADKFAVEGLMSQFVALMDRQPVSNEFWAVVQSSRAKARQEAEQARWENAGPEWTVASMKLKPSVQLMRAAAWVSLAEQAIKKGDAPEAGQCAAKALAEFPGLPSARLLRELAGNRVAYEQRLAQALETGVVNAANKDELLAKLNLYGGPEWARVNESVKNAGLLATLNQWEACNEEWKKVAGSLPGIILALRIVKIEQEARRENWGEVSTLADSVIKDYPNQPAALELKNKAEIVLNAKASERGFQFLLGRAIEREVADNHISPGTMDGFYAHMDRYGRDEWTAVKEMIAKAEQYGAAERGPEGSNAWKQACALLPAATARMRAEVTLEKAENELKQRNWDKVLAYAQAALAERPDLARARQLRDQADGIVEMRCLGEKYKQAFKEASGQLAGFGIPAYDQSSLLTNLSQYGGANWASLTQNIVKAEEFEKQGKHAECVGAWQTVFRSFPIAIRELKAGYWVAKADKNAKDKLWAKASIEAEKALLEDPENHRAKALMVEIEKNSK